MNARMISFVFGTVFVAVGLLGFTPNPVVSIEGFFAVNTVHNLVHILTGITFIACAYRFPGNESTVVKIIGLVYFAVTALGFMTSGNMMLGIIHINEADRWLHLGLAIAIFVSGFVFSDKQPKLSTQHPV